VPFGGGTARVHSRSTESGSGNNHLRDHPPGNARLPPRRLKRRAASHHRDGRAGYRHVVCTPPGSLHCIAPPLHERSREGSLRYTERPGLRLTAAMMTLLSR
jgi:hypothetical protein